ncbi:prepilin-type N-terminal cleavage/methylation domain-containing protein [Vibrio sp. F74]|uniref:prepilin-type N-terminal cleavage/methylation domain-containing protein n=2 Tax=unclassified Vibrio TaxID=2614977 RepID=UPI0036F1F910
MQIECAPEKKVEDSMKKQTGFSLVELVIVIVVVGLLAVAALPKFLDITDEAKKASIEGVAGGFATAVLSARAQWEAESRPQVNNVNVVDYDGVDFILTDSSNNSGFRDGYPLAVSSTANSGATGATNAICLELMENLLQNPPTVVENDTSDADARYSAAATNSGTCTYTQLEGSTNHNFEYDITTGRVLVNLTN